MLVALADVRHHYGLPIPAFVDLVDGCEMDVRGTVYTTADELVVYCRRVAGAIGRHIHDPYLLYESLCKEALA